MANAMHDVLELRAAMEDAPILMDDVMLPANFEDMQTSVLAILRSAFSRQQQRPKSLPASAPDWSQVKSRYQDEVNRHTRVRQRAVSMAPQHVSITPVYVYQVSPPYL